MATPYGPRMTLEPLRWQLHVSWSLLTHHLDRLTEEECRWQPSPESWTVRQADGRWLGDWIMPEPPEPVPPSIAWVTWHIGLWWTAAYDHTFGTAHGQAFDWDDKVGTVTWPGDVPSTVTWLTALHDQWSAALETVKDLDEPVAWFPEPLGHVIAWANVELMKNAAEVGQLRFHYRALNG
jgi:hypothetical protein